MEKTERLLNLIALLMETRRPLTSEQIRAAIYRDQSDAAFKRMFERDKEELRDMGVPVERAPTDVWDVEEGYLIRREEATLPNLDLTPDEYAALWLAGRAWHGQDDAARRALLKVSMAGGDDDDSFPSSFGVSIDAPGRELGVLLDAIAERRRVRFRYRAGGGGEPTERTVEPHALSYRGGWYLTGYDAMREAVRHFKLSRVDGSIAVIGGRSPQFEARDDVGDGIPQGPWEGDAREEARIAFSSTAAWWVERRTGSALRSERTDGWVEIVLPVADRETFVSWVLGFADDAEVLEPTSLREEIVHRLRRAAETPS